MKTIFVLLAIAIFLTPFEASSRNTRHLLSIDKAIQSPDFVSHLDTDIALYFSDQKHPELTRSLGYFNSNKKTNAFNKSDTEACQWVFLSALLSLQARARKEGANAVINIVSYYKKKIYKSDSQFECHAGVIMAGVALRGEMVRVAK